MALTNVSKTEKNKAEVEFSIDAVTFESAVNVAYKKNVGKMNVPGFRKGKAPRKMIEKLYGTGVFYDEALNAVLPDAYEEAIAEAKLEVVSRPDFEVVSIDENGVAMKAVVITKPEVTIDGYKGIELTREVAPTTEDEINAEIESARKKNAREIEVTDRAAQEGDTCVIDFEGFTDGVAFEGGKGENHSLKLGSGEFIPGFEDQIAGHNVGEEFDVNVTFPEDYQAENLAGKEAVFKVALKSIKFSELPVLDDEFVKDVSEFDTLDEYKADWKAKITERHTKAADAVVEEKLLDTLLEKMEADIPEVMFENEVESGKRDLASRLQQNGMELKMYLQYTGMTEKDLEEQLRPRAEKQVKTRLALEQIARLEGFEATEDDLNAEYDSIAKAYGIDAAIVKAQLAPAMLEGDIKVRKAVDLVKSTAVITDAAPEEKKDEAVSDQ